MPPIVAQVWRLFLSLRGTDNGLLLRPEGSLFLPLKWCLGRRRSGSEPQPCPPLWPFPSLPRDDKENQEFISPQPGAGTFSIPSPPLYSPDLIWSRAILPINCWSFLFRENNVTLVNLKRLAPSTNCLYNSFCPLIIFHLVLLFKGGMRAVFTHGEEVGVGSEFWEVVECSHGGGWRTKSRPATERMLIRDRGLSGGRNFPPLPRPPRQHCEKRVSGSGEKGAQVSQRFSHRINGVLCC